jgi:hypothetical protein
MFRVVDRAHLKLVSTWDMTQIRRFGCVPYCFHFEAGRAAETGEGKFYVRTNKALEIASWLARIDSRSAVQRNPSQMSSASLVQPQSQAQPPPLTTRPPLASGTRVNATYFDDQGRRGSTAHYEGIDDQYNRSQKPHSYDAVNPGEAPPGYGSIEHSRAGQTAYGVVASGGPLEYSSVDDGKRGQGQGGGDYDEVVRVFAWREVGVVCSFCRAER